MATAWLLDVTRLVSRLGRGPLTGVDRVEQAYLVCLLADPRPLFGLVRTAAGFLVLDRAGMLHLAALVQGAPLGPSDWLSRLTNRRDPVRGRAEAAVRQVAVARSLRGGLRRLVRRVPEGAAYLSTGHANPSALATLSARMRCAVLVHDTIPLDHPDLSRPGTPARFARLMAAVSAHADLVIHQTATGRASTEAHLHRLGRCPPGVVAALGVPVPQPGPLPPGLAPVPPYFVALGTVEPRKNHALLCQVWADLARDGPPPALYVVGGRGWADPGLFDALAATPGVHLVPGLNDGAVAQLLQGAAALVFPTLAEGFGLPPVEAAALGTPVICSDLPVLREVLGDYPVYLDPSDRYSWTTTIRAHLRGLGIKSQQSPRVPPDWTAHFNAVLSLL